MEASISSLSIPFSTKSFKVSITTFLNSSSLFSSAFLTKTVKADCLVELSKSPDTAFPIPASINAFFNGAAVLLVRRYAKTSKAKPFSPSVASPITKFKL